MSVIDRFNEIYIHESHIRRMVFEVKEQKLIVELDQAGIPDDLPEGIKYEYYIYYKYYYEPAQLEFLDVQQVNLPEHFFWDYRILEYLIRPGDTEGYYCFTLNIDGGPVGGVWARPIEIIAKDFKLGGNLVDYVKAQEEKERNNHD